MDEYRARVDAAARKRSGEPIYNASIEHAAVLVEKLFEYARDHVSILTGALNPRVYGREEVREQARLFLADSAHKLQVIVEDENANLKNHPLLEDLSDYANFELRIMPAAAMNAFKFHFIVMDNDSYRFESDKAEPTAVAAFGDTKGAAGMNDLFNSIWAIAPIRETVAA